MQTNKSNIMSQALLNKSSDHINYAISQYHSRTNS